MSNKIYWAENLDILRMLPDESVDLVYTDPPFNTGHTQKRQNAKMSSVVGEGDRKGFGDRQYVVQDLGEVMSYTDSYHGAYLQFISLRLQEIHRVLKPSGSLYLHLDYRESPYVRIVGDSIFGRENYLNEIIWAYDYGGKPKNRWPAKHDNINVWVKSLGSHFFSLDDIDRIPYMAPGMVSEEKAKRGKLPTDCYSSDTEVLTGCGWKLFSDLTDQDVLASVSPSGSLLYCHPSKLHAYHYDGDMYHMKSKTIDLLVTPNHNMWIRPKHGKSYVFVPSSEVSRWQYVSLLNKVTYDPETTSETTYSVPVVEYQRPGKPLPSFDLGDWCEFIGWFLSEGCTVTYRDRKEVCISQTKNTRELEDLLSRMKLSWSCSRGTYTISNKQLHSFVRSFGTYSYNKEIPREFLDLGPQHLSRLLHGLMLGDGSKRLRRAKSREEDWCYHTTSYTLASQVQEIFFKLGHSANISTVPVKARMRVPKYIVQRRTSTESTIWRDRHISIVPYSGMVYCATVDPHHTLVVRRNNKMAICGNCWWHTIVSPTGKEKTGYPTQKPVGLAERIVRASSPPGGIVLDIFAGSGTVGEAALKNNRHFILVDSNKQAIDVMRTRFSSYLTNGHKIKFINKMESKNG